MPQYMLSVCHDEPYDDIDFEGPEIQRIGPKVEAVNEALQSAGAWVYATGLRPISSATVVRSDAGKISMTDGPFAESKEHIGGFWIIDVADLDAALEWAGRCTEACEAPVELRPCEGA